MNRDELTLVIAGTLLAAVLLGWILHVIYALLNSTAGPRSIKKTADLASKLDDAEAARHEAETRLREVEHDLTNRLRQMQRELDIAADDLRRTEGQLEDLRAVYAAEHQQGPGS